MTSDLLSRIKRRVKFKKAKKYFDRVDINALIEKAEFVQGLCLNTLDENGKTYLHTIPLKDSVKKNYSANSDDWDLPEEILVVVKNDLRELSDNYVHAKTIYSCTPDGKLREIESPSFLIKDKLLPPWLAYPTRDRYSLFWRQSGNEDMFYDYLGHLTPAERSKYCDKYPMPAYFGGLDANCIKIYRGNAFIAV